MLSVKCVTGGWHAAHCALPLNSASPRSSCGVALAADEAVHRVELRRRRKVDDGVEVAHVVGLRLLQRAAADGGQHRRVAVEVLLDLGEVVHGADRALRREQQLRVVAAHGRRVDAQARVVRPRVGRELDGAVGVAVDVAREAGDALRRLGGDAVVRDVEPGGLERRDQQAQPVELLGREEAVEHVEVVAVGDLDAARDVAQLGMRGQIERRRKLRQVAVGDVEADVEALVLGMHARPLRAGRACAPSSAADGRAACTGTRRRRGSRSGASAA